MENLSLVTEIKQNIGDRIIGYAQKNKQYILRVVVVGEPRLQFHLQDELTGKFILCINRITNMITGTYTYKFTSPEDSILVYDIFQNGTVQIDYFGEAEV